MTTDYRISKGIGNMGVYSALAGFGSLILLLPAVDQFRLSELVAVLSPATTEACWPDSAPMVLTLGVIGVVASYLCLLPATLWARRRMGLKHSRRLLATLPMALATVAILCWTFAELATAHASGVHCDGRLGKSGLSSISTFADVWLLWMQASAYMAVGTMLITAGLLTAFPRKWKRYG